MAVASAIDSLAPVQANSTASHCDSNLKYWTHNKNVNTPQNSISGSKFYDSTKQLDGFYSSSCSSQESLLLDGEVMDWEIAETTGADDTDDTELLDKFENLLISNSSSENDVYENLADICILMTTAFCQNTYKITFSPHLRQEFLTVLELYQDYDSDYPRAVIRTAIKSLVLVRRYALTYNDLTKLYADQLDIDIGKLRSIEIDFLTALEWKVWVKDDDLLTMVRYILEFWALAWKWKNLDD
ncbi:hypothetical protein G9A89_020075 [Geosiphon pyriformis]|nr:hypothetical protein G9A89_020075 [Geosiphon pyriformis]